jgi:hypothetical protein
VEWKNLGFILRHCHALGLKQNARVIVSFRRKFLGLVGCCLLGGVVSFQCFSAPSAPDGAPPAAPKILFDGSSLEGWVPSDFGGRGEVELEDGSIVLGAGNDLTGVTYRGELPKGDYEVELDAKRLDGGDFFCGLTVPVGENHCTLVVGGWGGGLVGISCIDGLDASENATTSHRKFDSGRWYQIRLRVTAQKIQAWIDGDPAVDAEIGGKKISMRRGEIELSQPLGIASFRTRAALRRIQIKPL